MFGSNEDSSRETDLGLLGIFLFSIIRTSWTVTLSGEDLLGFIVPSDTGFGVITLVAFNLNQFRMTRLEVFNSFERLLAILFRW